MSRLLAAGKAFLSLPATKQRSRSPWAGQAQGSLLRSWRDADGLDYLRVYIVDFRPPAILPAGPRTTSSNGESRSPHRK